MQQLGPAKWSETGGDCWGVLPQKLVDLRLFSKEHPSNNLRPRFRVTHHACICDGLLKILSRYTSKLDMSMDWKKAWPTPKLNVIVSTNWGATLKIFQIQRQEANQNLGDVGSRICFSPSMTSQHSTRHTKQNSRLGEVETCIVLCVFVSSFDDFGKTF